MLLNCIISHFKGRVFRYCSHPPTLGHGPLEEILAERRYDHVHHIVSPRRLPSNGHFTGIASEKLDVFLNPFKGLYSIKRSIVSRVGKEVRATCLARWVEEPAQRAKPILDVNYNNVRSFGQVLPSYGLAAPVLLEPP
jgi:hypothetical protein